MNKKRELLKCLILLVLMNANFILTAQNISKDFGDISVEDLKEKICPIDSNAVAYYIFDYGNTYFEYGDTKVTSHDLGTNLVGFQTFFTRHLRIKILDKKGFESSNIEIPLYQHGGNDRITKIKAFTYNLKNFEIEKSKLSGKDIFNEESNKYWTIKKFAMPNVQVGSIIEIEYTIKSDYSYLRPWYFQDEIPTLESDYYVSIPEYFHYDQTETGAIQIQKETSHNSKELNITYIQKAEGVSVKRETFKSSYNYREDVFSYHADNIPAFPKEAYLINVDNYLSKITFELDYTIFPNSAKRDYSTSWEAINQNLLDDKDFGAELNSTSHLKTIVKELKTNHQTDKELVNGAFDFVKKKMTWNKKSSIYVSSKLSKSYKEGSGNCADVNMNLIALLRASGLAAYPVILSTQRNGIIPLSHPSINSFNYVVAMVKIGEKMYLMDATAPNSKVDLLPIRCLNGQGRIIHLKGGDWIDLMNNKSYSMIETYQLDLQQDFSFNGLNKTMLKNYGAYVTRNEILFFNDMSDFQKSIESKNINYSINEIEVIGLDKPQKSLKMSIDFTQKDYVETTDNIAFFKPVFQPFISENPFQLEQRAYPIEFNYPYKIKQIYSIKIPEGYTITEIPKALSAQSPDGSMKYVYDITQSENDITVTVIFEVSRTLFLAEEYQNLKAFYQMMVDKQKELVVLSK